MSETITVKDIKTKQDGWSTVYSQDGKIFKVGPDKKYSLEAGKSYDITTVKKKNTKYGGDDFYVIECKPSGNGVAHSDAGVVRQAFHDATTPTARDENIKQIADAKNKSIEEASLLKAKSTGWAAASQVAEACARAFASTDAVKTWDWDKIEIQIRKVRQMEFEDYCRATKLPIELPF